MSAAPQGWRPEDSIQQCFGRPTVKPFKSILDRSFIYVPSTATSVDQTWRRFGWRPTTQGEGTTDERHASATKLSSASQSNQAVN